MKLEFTLLVVDDAPDNVEQAVAILSDHLETKGFVLTKRIAKDLSEHGLKDLARSEGRDYDLVMVDFNLGSEDIDGAIITHQLRNHLPYTDMVFYSSATVSELLSRLAANEVSGVFAERREDLGDALTGLADTIIGKAIDLNHMRGIAMAEVAEMDVLMEETLVRSFDSANCNLDACRKRTMRKLRKSIQDILRRVDGHIEAGCISAIVVDGRVFSSIQKYFAIKRVAKCLPEKPTEQLKVLEDYETEVIRHRNILAHAKEESTDNGEFVLRSIKGAERDIILDDNWMVIFRQNLRKHRDALSVVCDAIDRHFVGFELTDESDER